MPQDVVKYGDPVLRRKADPLSGVSGAIRKLAREMIEAMHAANGVGLAAQQIGRTEDLCVIDVPENMDVDPDTGLRMNPDASMPLGMINLRIVEKRGSVAREEGCLSFPEIFAKISRAAEVTVRYVDLQGVERTLAAKGMVARAIQHEFDHLSGVLIVDRMSPVARISQAGRIKKIRKETESRLRG